MKFHSTFLALLVATTFRTWFTDILIQAGQVSSSNEAETAAQTAGSDLPGLPVRTSKGEKDMKHPKMVYGHEKELEKYAPISSYLQGIRSVSDKHIFLHCLGCCAELA